MYIKLIGLTAASLTTIAFLPQAIKTWKNKSTDDLSPGMFYMLCIGVVLWLTYGILKNDLPIILANTLTLCLASVILFYIIKANHTVKIDHIALWTVNLEEMKDFYCLHFNATASKHYNNPKTEFSSYFIHFKSGARIELMHKPDYIVKNDEYSGHISISLGSKTAVDKYTQYFTNKNIEVVGAPRTTGDGYYESVIKDPEGNLIELTV